MVKLLLKKKNLVGEWKDDRSHNIKIDEIKVSEHGARLYGGQQFNRLLREFKIIGKSLKMPPISLDNIASAIGPSKLK